MISLSIQFSESFLPLRSLKFSQDDLADVRLGVANEVRELVAARFRSQGGRKWWYSAARATRRVRLGEQEVIRVEQRGVRLQWLGKGVNISPRGRLLTLPARGVSEHAGAHANLLFIPARKPYPKLRGWLVQSEPGRRGIPRPALAPDGRLRIAYSLVQWTHHEPHPDVVPSAQEMAQAAQQAAARAVDKLISKTHHDQ